MKIKTCVLNYRNIEKASIHITNQTNKKKKKKETQTSHLQMSKRLKKRSTRLALEQTEWSH